MQVMIAVADVALLFAGVFVLGVLNDAFRPGSITAVAISCPPELRRRALALNRLALNLGWSFGPTIGGYLVATRFELMFVADGGTCVAAALFLAFTFRRWNPPPPPPRQKGDSLLPFRDGRFLWLMGANLVVLIAFMQYFTTGSRVFEESGWSKTRIGWFLAINPIMITLFEMIVVHTLRGHRALPVIAIGSAVIGLGHLFLLLPLGGTSIVLAMIVVAGGELLQMPMLGAHVNDHAAPQVRGAYNGALGMTFCLALVLAPVAGGFVYQHAGAAALWWMCAALGLLGALCFLAAARRERTT
jgi:predicted MFS family arabinose efflux permease